MQRLAPLRLLIVFDAVHRLGSMRLAAAETNVTRPAVSQAIRALEDRLCAQGGSRDSGKWAPFRAASD